MKTRIVHNKLGSYNFCDPSDKSETYVLMFDEADRDNKTVEFTYSEDSAPCLDIKLMTPLDLIDELECYQSKRFLYSSSYPGAPSNRPY